MISISSKGSTIVVNKRAVSKLGPEHVYIGRGSIWGNPYSSKRHARAIYVGSRKKSMQMYRKHILQQPELLQKLHTLRGKTLVCSCKPRPCHGDVLVELLERMDEMAAFIDYTLLDPKATPGAVERLCREAIDYKFHAVCVHSFFLPQAASLVAGTGVKTATVIDFPHGSSLRAMRVLQVREAVREGADELDIVAHLPSIAAGNWSYFASDLKYLRDAAQDQPIKLILETALWDDAAIAKASKIALKEGIEYIKTSTGFGPGGATVATVELIKSVVGDGAGIKASGGISDWRTAQAMINAGATRIGSSKGISILTSLPAN